MLYFSRACILSIITGTQGVMQESKTYSRPLSPRSSAVRRSYSSCNTNRRDMLRELPCSQTSLCSNRWPSCRCK